MRIQFGKTQGHSCEVTAVGISPNGRVVASGDILGNVVVWDVRGGRLVARETLRPNGQCVRHLLVNDREVYAGFGREVYQVYQPNGRRIGGHRHDVASVFFARGQLGSMSYGGSIRLWGGRSIRNLPAPYGGGIVAGGEAVAVSSRHHVLIFDTYGWPPPQVIECPPAKSVTSSQDRIYLGCIDGAVREFSHDGRVRGERSAVRVADGSRDVVVVRPAHSAWRMSSVYSLDGGQIAAVVEVGGGLFVAAGRGLALLRPKHPQRAEDISAGVGGSVESMAANAAKGIAVAGTSNGVLCLWDLHQPDLNAALEE